MQNNIENHKIPIEMALLLCEKYFSKEELMEHFEISSNTFSKYLTIIKKAGFNLVKRNKKYKINYFKNVLKLSNLNISLLAHYLTLSLKFLPNKITNNLFKITNDFLSLTNLKTEEELIEKYEFFKNMICENSNKEKIEKFQKCVDDKMFLKITTKEKKEQTLYPVRVLAEEEKIFFIFEDTKTKTLKEILSSEIIKMLPVERKKYCASINETIFELTGRLAKNYLLKEEERIIEASKDKIVVINSSVDKEKLFKRLIRYDVLCRIVQPAQDVENFKKFIEKSLDNLTRLNDN